ncbi:MAG: glycerol-3-phosphate 1-O-acyltransferase PlsY [Puniceicoccales bacterium]|jgi:glycerol-3-phosphate acyltransferase PlsY|nr:glycerol-3-phosphate 1-O-acyltransferase PlsY [Puniceicoccales bacterium]
MAPFFWPITAALVGYLLGSISFAVIIARRYGVDILQAGSGNPGATNVKRVCGRKPGNLVFALDVLKGLTASGWPQLAVWLAAAVQTGGDLAGLADSGTLRNAQLAGFVGAVLGHCFSVFLRFKGGKGVAVSAGGLLGAMPVCFAISGVVWLVAYRFGRYVSVASLIAGAAFPVAAYLYYGGACDPRFWLGVAIAVFFIFTHRSNIIRLLRGEESGFKKGDRRE